MSAGPTRTAPADLPWVHAELASARAAHAAGRLPHALLIHESPGAGGMWLAERIAMLVLCTRTESAPCGQCSGCARVRAGQHPDLVHVGLLEDSKQIKVEQVRDLAAELALTSHQGGYKVGVLAPADALNRNAANALLKTLEEPTPRTLLILVAVQPSRLPATILSRCQRLRVRAPAREQTLAWLQHERGPADWNAVLDVIGEAPLLAATLDPRAVSALRQEVLAGLGDLSAGRADATGLAERWSRSELPLRLDCIENWLTECIRRRLAPEGESAEMRAGAHLPGTYSVLNIRELFELLDGVRELKFLLDAPINRALALENLLCRLAAPRGGGVH